LDLRNGRNRVLGPFCHPDEVLGGGRS